MDTREYESRRKSQNREAQRRYRQKQKERSGSGASVGESLVQPSSEDWAHLQLNDEAYMVDLPDFNSTLASYYGDMMVDLSTEDIHDGAVPTPSVLSGHDVCFGMATPRSFSSSGATGASNGNLCNCSIGKKGTESESQLLPKTHAKIYDKATRVTTDLIQLYDFGVEMQLIWPDQELHGLLNSLRDRFAKVINLAANAPSHD